jgi:hypothetical protein
MVKPKHSEQIHCHIEMRECEHTCSGALVGTLQGTQNLGAVEGTLQGT